MQRFFYDVIKGYRRFDRYIPLLVEDRKEPSDKHKQKLLDLLERFLKSLPKDLDEFKSWFK